MEHNDPGNGGPAQEQQHQQHGIVSDSETITRHDGPEDEEEQQRRAADNDVDEPQGQNQRIIIHHQHHGHRQQGHQDQQQQQQPPSEGQELAVGEVQEPQAPDHVIVEDDGKGSEVGSHDPGRGNDLALNMQGEPQAPTVMQQMNPSLLPAQQQGMFSYPAPSWPIPGGPAPPGTMPQLQPPLALQQQQQLHYYESRMRDHAAAYASAAAGAAWAAAQIAANVASSPVAPGAFPQQQQQAVPMILPSPPMFHMPGPMMQQPQPPSSFYEPPMPIQQQPQSMHHSDHPMPQQQEHPANMAAASAPCYYYPPAAMGSAPSHPGNEDDNSCLSHSAPSMEDSEGGMYYSRHRRKRQQRMPPSMETNRQLNQHSASMSSPSNQNQVVNSALMKRTVTSSPSPMSTLSPEKRGRRRRRFFRNDTGGSSGETGDALYRQHPRRRCKATRNNYSKNATMFAASSSSDGGAGANPYHHSKKKQQRQPSDDSLLGKTGVSALYEWCGKRRTTMPTFSLLVQQQLGDNNEPMVTNSNSSGSHQEDFEMVVAIDGTEWGRGRGRTKSAAKQEAARRALQALLPGVVFDEASGVLVELPSQQQQQQHQQLQLNLQSNNRSSRGDSHNSSQKPQEQQQWLEELAPNLAKRLAIGRNDDEDDDCDEEDTKGSKQDTSRSSYTTIQAVDSKKRHKPLKPYQSRQQHLFVNKKWQHVYPGTSTTTSEEEDENAYYASRGASVCSALLHAMVQIDERIPEAPTYTYQVSTVPSTANAQLKRKGGPADASYPASSIVIHRGSHTCTATMKLLKMMPWEGDNLMDKDDPTVESNMSDSAFGRRGRDNDDGSDVIDSSCRTTVEKLQASGVGGTKREARHIASAKLLAQLFPECNGMVQVKEAAEAAREKYAASKALKQQSKREQRAFIETSGTMASTGPRRLAGNTGTVMDCEDADTRKAAFSQINSKNLSFAMASQLDPVLPVQIARRFRAALGNLEELGLGSQSHQKNSDDCTVTHDVPREEKDEGSLARQRSRQKQFDEQLALALQKLNEHDEEGRCLPDELTVDDVGRTLLRRAGPEDIGWIDRLFGAAFRQSKQSRNGTFLQAQSLSPLSPTSVLGAPTSREDGNGRDHNNDMSGDKDSTVSLALSPWSSSTIVLLLCRAIAPYEDPPLGCAVLTLGFSMEKGKLLRIAKIASEPHLPRERFIECLQSFASCMSCSLETSASAGFSPSTLSSAIENGAKSFTEFRPNDLQIIVESHLGMPKAPCRRPQRQRLHDENDHMNPSFISPNDDDNNHQASADCAASKIVVGKMSLPLQSVLEEEESEDAAVVAAAAEEESDRGTAGGGTESSLAEKRNAKKARDSKPCKRSRVQ